MQSQEGPMIQDIAGTTAVSSKQNQDQPSAARHTAWVSHVELHCSHTLAYNYKCISNSKQSWHLCWLCWLCCAVRPTNRVNRLSL